MGLALACSLSLHSVEAQQNKERILYSFAGGNDAADPQAGLIIDAQGNLYGTTSYGGIHDSGTVFKSLTRAKRVCSILLGPSRKRLEPYCDLLLDRAGNLYGTTAAGGTYDLGTVFKVAPDGTETVLYSFRGGNDGATPIGGVTMDKDGNPYGTTFGSGSTNVVTVFKLTPQGVETVLHAFLGPDGASPLTRPVLDREGNLYGTTQDGGSAGYGVIFKISPDGNESTLYDFTAGNGGGGYPGGVIIDEQRNLYGTANLEGASGEGVVFELTPDGIETVLHNFAGGGDGSQPTKSLIRDRSGNLYGTTLRGGARQ